MSVNQSIVHRDDVELSKLGYSNIDHTMDEGLESVLKSNEGRLYALHGADNFVGYLFYEKGKFFEEVWIYGCLTEVRSDTDLKRLISETNDEYGYG